METSFPIADFIVALSHRQMAEAIDVASVALFVYDYAITFGMEVELIWMSPWNVMKILYLIQRYMPFVDSAIIPLPLYFRSGLSRAYCDASYKGSGWMFMAGIAISELILTLRTWAVWGKDKRLGYALPVFFLLCWVPSFVIMGIFLDSLTFLPVLPGLGCFVSGANPVLYMCWVLLMIYDAGILVLMLIPGITAYKRGGDSALFNAVYRDGVVYYLYLFVLSVINVVVILILPPDYVTFLSSLARVIHSMLASRVLLHIREQAYKDPVYVDGLSDIRVQTENVGTMEFRPKTATATVDTSNV